MFIHADRNPVLERVPNFLIGMPGRSPNAVSLLSRDILSRFRLVVDFKANLVELH
ncbi:MAG: hypothetical protein AAB289_06235 [Chloroflexota bacterium]